MLLELTGLWIKVDANGKKYMVGNLPNGNKFLVLPNKYKKTDNQPDYVLCIAEGDKGKPKEAPKQETSKDIEPPF